MAKADANDGLLCRRINLLDKLNKLQDPRVISKGCVFCILSALQM
jgi:hypothetical protein